MYSAPPAPPKKVTFAEGDDVQRGRMLRWQLFWTTITILATTWFCTLGWGPGILAVMVAKHVLVAIIAAGVGLDRSEPVEP